MTPPRPDVARLRAYTQHWPQCYSKRLPTATHESLECDCGLDALLTYVEALALKGERDAWRARFAACERERAAAREAGARSTDP